MTAKPWIAIIAFPHPGGTKPYVLHDSELDHVETFKSPKAIERVMTKHLLAAGIWTAFNFETGETECLG